MPGSAHCQAARDILSQSVRALIVFIVAPVVLALSCQSLSSATALMKALSTRTELFEDWPETVL